MIDAEKHDPVEAIIWFGLQNKNNIFLTHNCCMFASINRHHSMLFLFSWCIINNFLMPKESVLQPAAMQSISKRDFCVFFFDLIAERIVREVAIRSLTAVLFNENELRQYYMRSFVTDLKKKNILSGINTCACVCVCVWCRKLVMIKHAPTLYSHSLDTWFSKNKEKAHKFSSHFFDLKINRKNIVHQLGSHHKCRAVEAS